MGCLLVIIGVLGLLLFIGGASTEEAGMIAVGVVMLGLSIAASVARSRISVVMKTPQYQLFLKAIAHLEENGYKIKERKNKRGYIQSDVYKDSYGYGYIFVVDSPPRAKGFLRAMIAKTELGKIINRLSDYDVFLGCIDTARTNLKRKGIEKTNPYICSHEKSLVGGVAAEPKKGVDTTVWISILKSVVTNKE